MFFYFTYYTKIMLYCQNDNIIITPNFATKYSEMNDEKILLIPFFSTHLDNYDTPELKQLIQICKIAFKNIRTSEDSMRYNNKAEIVTPERAELEFNHYSMHETNKIPKHFTILLKKKNKVVGVGYCSIYLTEQKDIISMAYFIDNPYRQKGLGTCVINLLIQYIQKQGVYSAIEIIIDIDNIPSKKLALKVGFKQKGKPSFLRGMYACKYRLELTKNKINNNKVKHNKKESSPLNPKIDATNLQVNSHTRDKK